MIKFLVQKVFPGIPHFVLLCCCLNYTLYTVGRLVTGLVREFLEYFELDFTIAVFDPETNFVSHALLNCPAYFW